MDAGLQLRRIREQLGLTLRDVESASAKIAQQLGNDEFSVTLSRISDIETKGVVPSIYRVYSFAAIYRLDPLEILAWYGIDFTLLPAAGENAHPPATHRNSTSLAWREVNIPVAMDPAFRLDTTTDIGRMIQAWGALPFAHLERLADRQYTYGYVGGEDFTMYPLIMPGAFLQIDEALHRIENRGWPSEYERPIYWIETRNGFLCAWCSTRGSELVVQPHPLSPVGVRTYRLPQDAEVIGQVVGVAMQIGQNRLRIATQHQEQTART